MANKYSTAQHQLLGNRHLKERNDNVASETEAVYQLRGKQGLERDQLRVERITDSGRHVELSTQQANEMAQLRQQQHQLRLAMLERQANERSKLK